MPTWRRWLDSTHNSEEFEASDYYKNWHCLLNDERFLNLAKENDLEICFYVHPKLNRFVGSFDEIKNVNFLNSKAGSDVQTHLKQAAIMITDFSSVFFDFAYMRKPAIYFQFDEDEFYKSHYKKAYFDYREDGFGEVVKNKDETIEELKDIIQNDLKIKDNYFSRCEQFFPLYDEKNCERIYEAIMEIIK